MTTEYIITSSSYICVNTLFYDEVGVGFILLNVLLHDVVYKLKLVLKLAINTTIMPLILIQHVTIHFINGIINVITIKYSMKKMFENKKQ